MEDRLWILTEALDECAHNPSKALDIREAALGSKTFVEFADKIHKLLDPRHCSYCGWRSNHIKASYRLSS